MFGTEQTPMVESASTTGDDTPTGIDDASVDLPDTVPADTIDDHDTTDDIDAQIRGELEFLTSLVWAPDTAAAIAALVGDHQHRAAGTAAESRIPLAHLHSFFLYAPHTTVFTTVIELVDEGSPVTPAILAARIGMTDRRLRPTLLAIAAPTGHGPLPGGADVPYLARAIVDAYYRRGYTALLSTMQHALAEADTDDLAGHWRTLTNHQQDAERRRLAIADALARL